MTTIKSYTDIEQSKKLEEILPIESADMFYHYNTGIESYYDNVPRVIQVGNHFEHFIKDIPCWSLAALLDIFPALNERNPEFCIDIRYNQWHIFYHSTAELSIVDTERYDNLVDACDEMIFRLHKLNLL